MLKKNLSDIFVKLLTLCIFLIFQFSFSPLDTGFVLLLIGWVCSIWSLGYFLYVVLLIGFYVANTKAQRLFLDSLISAGLMVFSSALLFQSYGIIGPNSDPILNRDVVYFAGFIGDGVEVPRIRLHILLLLPYKPRIQRLLQIKLTQRSRNTSL